jgi:PRTRC genetic system protein A
MKVAGYLIRHPQGLSGTRGIAYDYVLTGNGVFVEADSPSIAARIPVFEAAIRGLEKSSTKIVLKHGRIPYCLLAQFIEMAKNNDPKEVFAAIVWDNGYKLICPQQENSICSIKYDCVDGAVIELHSHGRMPAFFSGQDNRDETGYKFYGVVGKCSEDTEIKFRIGIYGYFLSMDFSTIFSGILLDAKEKEGEEMDGLPCQEPV